MLLEKSLTILLYSWTDAPFSMSISLLKNAVSWYLCRGWEGTVDKCTFVRIQHRKS